MNYQELSLLGNSRVICSPKDRGTENRRCLCTVFGVVCIVRSARCRKASEGLSSKFTGLGMGRDSRWLFIGQERSLFFLSGHFTENQFLSEVLFFRGRVHEMLRFRPSGFILDGNPVTPASDRTPASGTPAPGPVQLHPLSRSLLSAACNRCSCVRRLWP